MNIATLALTPILLASMASSCVKAMVKSSDDIAPAALRAGTRGALRTAPRSGSGLTEEREQSLQEIIDAPYTH